MGNVVHSQANQRAEQVGTAVTAPDDMSNLHVAVVNDSVSPPPNRGRGIDLLHLE
jgi:hypothetical protein